MDSMKSLKDLKLTKDEVDRLSEAFKKEEFRKLFAEYAEEISNPENRRMYEEQIKQMEDERGMDVTFIHPHAGHVLKTSKDGDIKVFVNICQNENLEKPRFQQATKPDGQKGAQWSIPHSFSRPKPVTDRSGVTCEAYDFVVHPDTYRMTESNERFRKMVENTALDGIEKTFGVTLDRKNVKRPKMKYKGTPEATIMRKKKEDFKKEETLTDILPDLKYPYGELSSEEKTKEMEKAAEKKLAKEKRESKGTARAQEEEEDSSYAKPKYIIKHQNLVELQDFTAASEVKTRPAKLHIEISLPLIPAGSSIDLDIKLQELVLTTEKPAKYRLKLRLPYPVDDDEGTAKFDTDKRTLTVTLPVVSEKLSALLSNRFPNGETLNGHHEENKETHYGVPSDTAPHSKLVQEVKDEREVDTSKQTLESNSTGLASEVKSSEQTSEPNSTSSASAESKDQKPASEYLNPTMAAVITESLKLIEEIESEQTTADDTENNTEADAVESKVELEETHIAKEINAEAVAMETKAEAVAMETKTEAVAMETSAETVSMETKAEATAMETNAGVAPADSKLVEEGKEQNDLEDDGYDVSTESQTKETPAYVAQPVQVHYVLPSYNFHQNDETLTVVINAKNVDRSSLEVKYLENSSSCYGMEVKMESIGSGGFPMHYKLRIACSEQYQFDSQTTTIDTGSHNVVLNMAKVDEALGPWDDILIGRHEDDMEVKQFLTDKLLMGKMDELDVRQLTKEPKVDFAEGEVLEKSVDKLTVKFGVENPGEEEQEAGRDGQQGSKDGRNTSVLLTPRNRTASETSDSIQVVHTKKPPAIHGILKRSLSRSLSESSGDDLQRQRTMSNGTWPSDENPHNSPPSTPEDLWSDNFPQNHETNIKKSVSFNDKVDQATFQSGKSVKTLTNTLKNKRRNARKHEERKQHRRERFNSGGSSEGSAASEHSGDEQQSQQQAQPGKKASKKNRGRKGGKGKDAQEKQGYPLHVQNGTGSESDGNENESQKGDDERTSDDKKIENESLKQISIEENVKSKEEEVEYARGDGPDVNSADDNLRTGLPLGSKVGKVSLKQGDGEDSDDEVGGSNESDAKKEEVFKPDTILSWNEGDKNRPVCAVEFTNSSAYELDLD